MATTATPPTTPPAIALAELLEEDDGLGDGAGLVDGAGFGEGFRGVKVAGGVVVGVAVDVLLPVCRGFSPAELLSVSFFFLLCRY